MSTISIEQLAGVFVEVADTLVDEFDLIDFLASLTTHVADVSGTAAVGLLLADHRDNLQFMAASEESARLLELFVVQNDEGPCRDCYATGEPVVVPDLAKTYGRWPVFAPRAVKGGFQSVCAIPMRHHDSVIGVLNLFDTDRDPFSPEDVRLVQALAHVATIGLLQEPTAQGGQRLTEHLQGALNSRIVVEQAKGVLAELHQVDVDTAFGLLRDYCRRRHLHLGRIAAAVVTDPASHPDLARGRQP